MGRARGCLRGVGIGMVALALLGAALLGGRWLRQWWALRPVGGSLAATLPDTALASGDFRLAWDAAAQQLSVAHAAEPERLLWQSVAGGAFVAAGTGEAEVEEARGSFFIAERRTRLCTAQRLEAMAQEGAAVLLRGTLGCGGGDPVPYTLRFAEAGPGQLRFVLTTEEPTLNRLYLSYASDAGEHFFGFGEQFSFFDLKGRRVPIWVEEQGIGRGAQPITAGANVQARAGGDWSSSYAPVPHYLTSRLRSLFLESYAYSVFDLRAADRVQLQVWEGEMAGRILYGESPAALVQRYTDFAGRMPPLPAWATGGAIIGMQGGTARVRQVWAEAQAQGVPVAAFWLQDWVGQRTTSFGKQLWWNWELDRDHYPEWESLVAELGASDVRVLGYASPFLADVSEKPNHRRNLFTEAAAQGFLVQDESGEPLLIQNTSFAAGLLDLSNPEATTWFEGVLSEEMLALGISGWMADFGEALPTEAQLASGADPLLAHNEYPEQWAALNRRLVEAEPEAERLFFNRAAFRQSPGQATLFWLGDQLVSWDEHDGIKTAVTGMLSSGLSGFSLTHSDIGGYTTITSPIADYHRSEELLLRWMELSAFTPIFRSHEGNRPADNVQIYTNERTWAAFARSAKIYAAWGFYRDALMREAAETGLPVVRHPFLLYPDDPATYALSWQSFFVGEELLVAPVLDPGLSEVRAWLPAGEWVHLWTGERYGEAAQSSWATVPAPLGTPALFYRPGSAVAAQFIANLREAGIEVPATD